jgi:hypothetical protein
LASVVKRETLKILDSFSGHPLGTCDDELRDAESNQGAGGTSEVM